VCVRVCVYVRACVRACVCVCACARACVVAKGWVAWAAIIDAGAEVVPGQVSSIPAADASSSLASAHAQRTLHAPRASTTSASARCCCSCASRCALARSDQLHAHMCGPQVRLEACFPKMNSHACTWRAAEAAAGGWRCAPPVHVLDVRQHQRLDGVHPGR